MGITITLIKSDQENNIFSLVRTRKQIPLLAKSLVCFVCYLKCKKLKLEFEYRYIHCILILFAHVFITYLVLRHPQTHLQNYFLAIYSFPTLYCLMIVLILILNKNKELEQYSFTRTTNLPVSESFRAIFFAKSS